MRLNFFLSRKTTRFQYVMLNCLIITMALWGRSQALACTEMPKISQTEAKVKSVLFQRGETKEFCLKLPPAELKPLQNKFVEWHTVNLGNASCGVLRMKVVRPNKNDIEGKMSKRREISQGVQPGAVLVYTQGKWRAKYTLIEPCKPGLDRWDLGVSWSVK